MNHMITAWCSVSCDLWTCTVVGKLQPTDINCRSAAAGWCWETKNLVCVADRTRLTRLVTGPEWLCGKRGSNSFQWVMPKGEWLWRTLLGAWAGAFLIQPCARFGEKAWVGKRSAQCPKNYNFCCMVQKTFTVGVNIDIKPTCFGGMISHFLRALLHANEWEWFMFTPTINVF